MTYHKAAFVGVAAAALSSWAVVASAATDTAASATAASADNGTSLTAVVVTARKRNEDLQRVPVVVQNFTAKQLTQRGIREPADLSREVPGLANVVITVKSTQAAFVVRGQSASDTTIQFGTPVGVYEDGVNIPHPVGANVSFFDLSGVQVLKGPQGTLYGRNTTGGAVLITTRDADFNGLHGFAEAEIGNYQDWKVDGAVNIPLIEDKLSVRLAAWHWGRQGYGQSLLTGQHMGGDHDDTLVRGTIRFTPSTAFSSDTEIEYGYMNRANTMGKADAINPGGTVCNPAFTGAQGVAGEIAGTSCPAGSISFPLLAQTAPGLYSATYAPAGYAVTPDALTGGPQGQLNAQFGPGVYNLANIIANTNQFQNYTSYLTSDRVKVFHVAHTMTFEFGDLATLKSITGYHYYQDFNIFNEDGGLPGNWIAGDTSIISVNGTAPLPQSLTGPDQMDGSLTQEFDLSGKWNNLKWLVGAFGSRDKGVNEQWVGLVGSLGTGTFLTYGVPYYRNTTLAVFTQEDFKFNDVFSITGGVRYTQEKVSQVGGQWLYTPGNPPASQYRCAQGPNAGRTFADFYNCMIPQDQLANINTAANPILEPTMHATSSGVSYLASANFQVTPDMLLYLRTAKGFHGTVLQPRGFTGAPAQPETAVDYEIGYKSEFFDHRLRVDLAGYTTHYAGKQESVLSGQPPITIIFNAATANIRGFEGAFDLVPMTGVTLNATVGYTDAKYGHFIASSPSGKGFVDATGTAFPTVPPWTYSVGGRYEHEVGPGNLSVSLDWAWRSALPLTVFSYDPLVPLSIQQSFKAALGLLNGEVTYELPSWNTTFSIFSTNLLNKHYQFTGTSSETDGSIYGNVQEPIMFGFRVRKTFGSE